MNRLLSTIQLSWQLLISSASFLNRNRDLVFFPIISIIASIAFLMLTVFSGILGLSSISQFASDHVAVFILLLLLVYFFVSCIILYFNASLIACASLRLQGKPASIGDGLELAAKHWKTLIQWSLLSTTVGCLIRSLENSHNTIAEIVGFLLGGAWAIGAYFVVPVLLFENVGPLQALKRGYSVFGRGWRKVIAVNGIFTLILAAIFGILITAYSLFPAADALLLKLGIALFIITMLFTSTVGAAFNSIVCSALYLNIMQDKSPEGFDRELLKDAFQRKQRGWLRR